MTDNVHIRTPGKAYAPNGRHIGPGQWLDLIHEANRVTPDMFGAADSTGEWWAGGYVEEYHDARVLHRPDGTVSVVSKTDAGTRTLATAAAHLGMATTEIDEALNASATL